MALSFELGSSSSNFKLPLSLHSITYDPTEEQRGQSSGTAGPRFGDLPLKPSSHYISAGVPQTQVPLWGEGKGDLADRGHLAKKVFCASLELPLGKFPNLAQMNLSENSLHQMPGLG